MPLSSKAARSAEVIRSGSNKGDRTTPTPGIRQLGKCHDVFARAGGGLLIKERNCVYDTVLIDNCLVFPV